MILQFIYIVAIVLLFSVKKLVLMLQTSCFILIISLSFFQTPIDLYGEKRNQHLMKLQRVDINKKIVQKNLHQGILTEGEVSVQLTSSLRHVVL
jgi:hypothetical protein